MIPENIIEEFSSFLNATMGLKFPLDRRKELEKKFLLIMRAFGHSNPRHFLEELNKDPFNKKQIQTLAIHLSVGETSFFRDGPLFHHLKNQLLPDLLKRHREDRSIRIWCAGCCTGEEPYSLAMMLHQLIPDWKNWKIDILGTDINPDFLSKAEKARYKKWSFRHTSPDLMARYFIKNDDSTFSLLPEIQKNVRFAYLNLVKNKDCKMYGIDLILCHNVLIYFSKLQICKVVEQMAEALVEGGWLSVSAIEVPYINHESLQLSSFSNLVLFEKKSKRELESKSDLTVKPHFHDQPLKHALPPLSIPEKVSKPVESIPPKKETENKQEMERVYEESLLLKEQKKYEQALSLLSSCLIPLKKNKDFFSLHEKEVTLLLQMYANQGQFIQLQEWCEEALRANKLNPLFHYFHGIALQGLDDLSGAQKALKKCLFIHSDFVAAHYLLGLVEQQQKHYSSSKKHFKQALELLENVSPDAVLMGTDGLTAARFKDFLNKDNSNHV